jgi:CheY-like chemotaxis protein
MVVEDDRMVRYMMKRALGEAGYQVLEAASAEDALEIMIRRNPVISLVLTDVVMPGRGGRELAETIQELRPGTPVLFTSGYTDGEIERRGLLRPDAAFLQKPFTPEALVRAVEKQLGR